MAIKAEYEKAFSTFTLIGVVILAINIYYYTYMMWMDLGWTHEVGTMFLMKLKKGGFFDTPLYTKLLALLLSGITMLSRHGRGKKRPWSKVLTMLGIGLILYVIGPQKWPIAYIINSVIGYFVVCTGLSYMMYNLKDGIEHANDMEETFEQYEELIDTKYSINLPTKYKYKGVIRNGWVNVVNPFRGTIILGTPGSGKSYSIYGPFMKQLVQKGYTIFNYDFKYPTLTQDLYNIFLRYENSYEKVGTKKPKFYVVNFKDPRYSLRCNPLNPQYIKDMNDCKEIADIIFENLGQNEKKDFFSQSAQLYLDCGISFLWIYQKGKYCTFPHLVELMCQPAEIVIPMMIQYEQLQTKVASFKEASDSGAKEQLAGQTASATVPIAGMSSPSLYWVLGADDFKLDINNPDEPKIVCVGNDPERKKTYGAALALIFGRLFRLINQQGKLPSAVLMDEAPTIKVMDIDGVIATARSNKVAMVIGGQDKSQFIRDYGEKYANVIFNTVGNIISGQVNGKTAEDFSKMFGKEFRSRKSQTLSDDSESIQTSFSEEELMPVNKIESLSQGTFFGKVADDFATKIDKKFFCAEVIVDNSDKVDDVPLPIMTHFGEDKIRERIISGDMRKGALEELAKSILYESSGGPFTDEEIQKALDQISENKKKEYLENYAEAYIENYINGKIDDNYKKIKDDIRNILIEHGVYKEDKK